MARHCGHLSKMGMSFIAVLPFFCMWGLSAGAGSKGGTISECHLLSPHGSPCTPACFWQDVCPFRPAPVASSACRSKRMRFNAHRWNHQAFVRTEKQQSLSVQSLEGLPQTARPLAEQALSPL